MKKLLLFFALTLVFAAGAAAQDKASDIKRLLELTGSEKMIDEMLGNVAPILQQQAQASGLSGEKLNNFVEFMTSEMKWLTNKLLNEEMIGFYDKFFTHEEIKDIVKFYESPTGKKMTAVSPEMAQVMMNAMMKYMPEFQERLMKKMDELK